MSLRFSDEDWNELILRNHSIRWLIGDIKTDSERLKVIFHPVFRVVMIYIVLFTMLTIVNAAAGTLFMKGDRVRGYFESPSHFCLMISGILMSLGMRHMLKQFHRAFSNPSMVKGQDFEKHRVYFGKYRSTLAMERGSAYRKWAIITFGYVVFMGLLLAVYLPFIGQQMKSWATMPFDHPWSYGAGCISFFFTSIVVIGNAVWYGAGCAVTGHKMLNMIRKDEELRVTPVSPDGKGGFYVLAQFSFALFLMGIPIVLYGACWALTHGMTLGLQIASPISLLVMGFSFFYPLWPAHSVMKMAKQKELEHISKLFEECHDKYILLNPGDEDVSDVLVEMSYIQARYDSARKMSVWPFNTRMIIRFSSLILLPLITFVDNLVKFLRVWIY